MYCATRFSITSQAAITTNTVVKLVSKIKGTEISQKVTELALEAIGLDAMPWQPDAIHPGKPQPFVGPEYALPVMAKYLNTRATSIYGGSNEVQRNIVAQTVLG